MTDRAVAKLQALVRIPTVSNRDPALVDTAAFDAFVAELERAVPAAPRAPRADPRRTPTACSSTGAGAAAERPVVLMAHLDVVPVDEDAPWQHPAFGADIARRPRSGAAAPSTTRAAWSAICEAVERLLEQDFTPAQDVWLSFGCDEEVFGHGGAAGRRGAATPRRTPWFVLDEGGAVAHEAFPGVEPPVGVIGVTEKGTTSLELRRRGPRRARVDARRRIGPTARLARAILRLENAAVPGEHARPDASS